MVDIQEKLKEIGPFVEESDDDLLVCRCEEVTKIRTAPVFDHTYLLTIKVPNDMVMKARFYKKEMAKEA